MNIKPLPTKLYLHLSSTSDHADFTVFTHDMRDESGNNRMPTYPFVCEVHTYYAPGVTTESVNAQLNEIRLNALYQELGEMQGKLDAKKEEISKLLCIGHEPVKVEAEWLPAGVPHTADVTTDDNGRIIVGHAPHEGPPFDAFDDDIPF